MTCEAHLLAFNEARMIVYAIRHYKTYCAKVVVHDLGSTDGTQAVAKEGGAELVQHDTKGVFDDMLNKRLKNTVWHGTDADWIICADADELFYFPSGAEKTLAAYDAQQVAVVNPYGYEMVSDKFPTTSGQIYDEVKSGARDDYWYGKPGIFSPKRVGVIDFGTGAHVAHATLHGGRKITVDSTTPKSLPASYMLHFHHVDTVEAIGEKYEKVIARLSEQNRRMKWGVQSGGLAHSQDKRRAIMAKLERILP